MIESHGRSNQTLVKAALVGGAIVPQIFPNFVGVEVVAAIETVDAREIAGVVWGWVHEGILLNEKLNG
jgi:hypothetical protein